MSTTRALNKRMGANDTGTQTAAKINFALPAELRQKIATLPAPYSFVPLTDGEVTLETLLKAYKDAEVILTDKACKDSTKLILEEYKLQAMKCLLTKLESLKSAKATQALGKSKKKKKSSAKRFSAWLSRGVDGVLLPMIGCFTADDEKKQAVAQQIKNGIRTVVFLAFAAASLALAGIDVFTDVGMKLALVFGQVVSVAAVTATAIITGVSIAFTAVTLLLSVAFELQMQKDTFGVSFGKDDLSEYFELKQNQVETVEKINRLLDSKAAGLPDEVCEQAMPLVNAFNKSVKIDWERFVSFKEPWYKKAGRIALMGAGALLAGWTGVSAGIGLISLLALSTGPLAIGIIAAVTLVAVVSYFALQASGLMSFFNPAKESFKKLTTELSKFTPISQNDLEHDIANDPRYVQSRIDESTEKKDQLDLIQTPRNSILNVVASQNDGQAALPSAGM